MSTTTRQAIRKPSANALANYRQVLKYRKEGNAEALALATACLLDRGYEVSGTGKLRISKPGHPLDGYEVPTPPAPAAYTVCWLCTQTVRVRADGQMAKHREPRSHAGKHGQRAVCPQSFRVPT